VPTGLLAQRVDEVDFGDLVEQRSISGTAEALALDDVEVSGSALDGLRLIGGRLTRCQFTDVSIVECDLSGVDVPDGRWHRVGVTHSRLAGVTVAGGIWQDVTLTDVRATKLDLRFATVRRTRFVRCDLTLADFTGATLDGVLFEGCQLPEARFAQVTVKRAEFVDCDMSATLGVEALRGAVVDATTLLSLAGPLAATVGIQVG
jgi:uncharacterized protein YjbI with pentapeptide repeats